MVSRVGKALAQARMDKKNAEGKSMTQKELATAVNAKPQEVNDLATRSLPGLFLECLGER